MHRKLSGYFTWMIAVLLAFLVISFFAIEKGKYFGSYENINLSMVKGDIQRYLKEDFIFYRNYTNMDCRIEPQYYYALSAVVIGVRDYLMNEPMNQLSPFDICIVWGDVGNKEILENIDVTMGYRMCALSYKIWPIGNITQDYIKNHFSNNHLIFSSEEMKEFFRLRIRIGSAVSIEGYLVNVYCTGYDTWATSLKRGDSWCEIVYINNLILDGEEFNNS
jgi:hypothetical protein